MSSLRKDLNSTALRASFPDSNIQTSCHRSMDLHALLGHLSFSEQRVPMHARLLFLG